MFRDCGGELSFDRYLKRIVLDDPRIEDAQHFVGSRQFLKSALKQTCLDVRVEKRVCEQKCGCRKFYAAEPGFVRKMFTLNTRQLAASSG